METAAYIGTMTTESKGPVAIAIESRLRDALNPQRLVIRNDSEKHRGHGGYSDGESHFSVEVESSAFAGLNRLARQRLVNRALGDLMEQRIHALAIRATAPGE